MPSDSFHPRESDWLQIAGPYLSFMMAVLLWLADDDELDLNIVSSDAAMQLIQAKIRDVGDSICDTSLFDHKFFATLEAAYMAHLKSAIMSFGREDQMKKVDLEGRMVPVEDDDVIDPKVQPHNLAILWSDGYRLYIDQICRDLKRWVDGKLEKTGDMRTKVILGKLIPRIRFLQERKMFPKNSILPPVTGGTPPIFSALFYTDLAHSLAKVSDGIAAVSLVETSRNVLTTLVFSRPSTGTTLSCWSAPGTSTPQRVTAPSFASPRHPTCFQTGWNTTWCGTSL